MDVITAFSCVNKLKYCHRCLRTQYIEPIELIFDILQRTLKEDCCHTIMKAFSKLYHCDHEPLTKSLGKNNTSLRQCFSSLSSSPLKYMLLNFFVNM